MKKALLALALLASAGLGTVHAQRVAGKKARFAAQKDASRKISSFTSKRSFPASFKYVSVGGGIGYANYFGTLSPSTNIGSTDFSQGTPYVGAFIMKRLSPNISVRANFAWIRLGGDDNQTTPNSVSNVARYVRNLHFRNDIKEFSLTLIGELLPTDRGSIRRTTFNPYAFAGISVFTNNPKALGPKGTQWENEWVELQPLKTEGQGTAGGPEAYSTMQIGVPFGIGVRYKLASNLDLALEFGYRLTFTGYLDDVNGQYADPKLMTSQLARLMSNRSAERTAAKSEEDRTAVLNGSFRELPINISRPINGGGNIVTEQMPDGTNFSYVKGWEKGQSPRGGGGSDYFITTSIHLSYIFGDASRGPRRY